MIAEPYRSWVIQGAGEGLPDWAAVGARFTPELGPYERRKDWLTGGGLLLLSGSGTLRGHTTINSAFADPVCRDLVEQWWARAVDGLDREGHLAGPDPEGHRRTLQQRFANQRLAHPLVDDPHGVLLGDWVIDHLRHQLVTVERVDPFLVEALSAVLTVSRRGTWSGEELAALLDAGDGGAELAERVSGER